MRALLILAALALTACAGDLAAVAKALSAYWGPWGRLVSEKDALRWAESVR